MSYINSKNQPLVTIVTVTYNSSKYVREAIEGVLAQTYSNIEYIIADDCSTDDTWDIINEYKDERIIAYRNERNLREYPNRNKAIDLAKGEYLIFIDGDDYIYPHALQILTTYMIDFPEVAFAIMCPENSKYIYPIKLSSSEIFKIEFSEFGIINKALTHTFYKTSILKNNKFRTEKFYSGDTLNRLEIAMHNPCLLVNDNLTWWRISEGQASKKLNKTLKNEQYLMSKELFTNTNCPLSENEKSIFISNSKIKITRQIFKFLIKLKPKLAIKSYVNNNINFLDLFFIVRKMNFYNPVPAIIFKK
jgi:glycosyltransferase involved in cell wall biosynthesis